MVANIEGFLVYRCIYMLYIDNLCLRFLDGVVLMIKILIIVDAVSILVNPNLIPSPCPLCNQINHQEPATTFIPCLIRDPSDPTLWTRAIQLTLSRAHFIYYFHFHYNHVYDCSLSSKLSIYVWKLSIKTWSLKCSAWKGFAQSLVFEKNLDDVVLRHENDKFSMVSRWWEVLKWILYWFCIDDRKLPWKKLC